MMKVDNLGYYENSLMLVKFVYYFEYMGWNNMNFYFVVELYYYFVCILAFAVVYFYNDLRLGVEVDRLGIVAADGKI